MTNTDNMLKVGDRAVTARGAGVVISNEEARRILGRTNGLHDPKCLGVLLDPGHEDADSPVYTFVPRERGSQFVRRETPKEAPAPAPVQSQHPADLKPRGVKAPMHLIPWSVMPSEFVPADIEAAAKECGLWPNGDAYREEVDADEDDPFTMAGSLVALLCKRVPMEDLARAFGYGAAKYEAWNWCTFAWDKTAENEYWGAICRHLDAEALGERNAADSGVLHSAHALAGASIWLWHELKIADARYEAEQAAAARPRPSARARKPFPAELRVGDRVRSKHKSNAGQCGTVRSVTTSGCLVGGLSVKHDQGPDGLYFPDELEREPAAFKVGDRVRWAEHTPLQWKATTPAGTDTIRRLEDFKGIPCAAMQNSVLGPCWFRLTDLVPA